MKKLKKKWITKDPSTRLYNIPVPIVALTGGISSGKSTVAQLFKDTGIPVIDADKLVKTIYQKAEAIDFVEKNFPMAVVNKTINFKILRELAFAKPSNQELLENFIYAQLPETFVGCYNNLPPHHFIVYDVPLLFEKKLDDKVDVSICVYTPRNIQIERLIKRDHIDKPLAEAILDKQMDIEEKKNKSDLFIQNNQELNHLKTEFEILLTSLTK